MKYLEALYLTEYTSYAYIPVMQIQPMAILLWNKFGLTGLRVTLIACHRWGIRA
jgi:hypothetical protein